MVRWNKLWTMKIGMTQLMISTMLWCLVIQDFGTHPMVYDPHNAACKKQLVEIPTTTVASSTTSRVVNGGCGRYTREGCLERNDSFVIDELFYADPIDCQHLCSGVFSDNCQSFQFDWDSGRCHLYSTPMVDVADCQDIGGPDDPSLQECKDIGCQVFIH